MGRGQGREGKEDADKENRSEVLGSSVRVTEGV